MRMGFTIILNLLSLVMAGQQIMLVKIFEQEKCRVKRGLMRFVTGIILSRMFWNDG